MQFPKDWFSYFYPQTIALLSSKYNKDIRIVQVSRQKNLYVDGSAQSGLYIKRLWRTVIKSFRINRHIPVKSMLVFGVAGGTVIHLLHECYPKANITGVDRDPLMIEIGTKYFGLGEIPSLTFVARDARRFVLDAIKKRIAFDMIVVDIFIGKHLPEFLLHQSFWKSVKTLLNEEGILLLNYLREDEYLAKSEKIANILTQLFFTVKDKKFYRNRFFFAQK